jgi:hypothetical protein
MTEQISFPPLHDLSPGEHETRKQHLLSEIRREPEWRRFSLPTIPPLRLRVAVPAAAAVCVAAVCAVVFTAALGGSGNHHTTYGWGGLSESQSRGTGNLAGSLPTVADPLGFLAKQTTLADATAMLGAPIVLPNTTLIQPSDAGPVWEAGKGAPSPTIVAVTFPSQGVIVEYWRPAPSDGSAAHFQAMAQSMPSPSGASEGQVITLSGGVPALAVQQNSDDTGHNFGSIIFNMAGSEVRVMGHNDEATLQAMALSILNQSGGSK